MTGGLLQFARAIEFLLAVGGLVFAAVGLRLFFLQSRLVFRPSRETVGSLGDYRLAFEEVTLDLRGAGRISGCVKGWWIPGSLPGKVILYFPGAIGNMSCEVGTLAWLAKTGAHVMAVDYPGFGLSPGRPSERGCYRAAEAAWRYAVDEKRIQPADVTIFGRSLGAGIAARLASQRDCGSLVIHSGVASVPAVAARRYPLLPTYFFCYIRFNALKYLRRCHCPTLVMHSPTDRVIPLSHGKRIFSAASSPKRFISLPGDHYSNEWQAVPGLADEVGAWLFSGLVTR